MDYFHHTDPHHITPPVLAYLKDGSVHTYTQLLSQNRIECKLAVYSISEDYMTTYLNHNIIHIAAVYSEPQT